MSILRMGIHIILAHLRHIHVVPVRVPIPCVPADVSCVAIFLGVIILRISLVPHHDRVHPLLLLLRIMSRGEVVLLMRVPRLHHLWVLVCRGLHRLEGQGVGVELAVSFVCPSIEWWRGRPVWCSYLDTRAARHGEDGWVDIAVIDRRSM